MRHAVALCAVIILSGLSAEAATGVWKNYTSMYEVRAVAGDGNGYWAATSGGLFYWSLADGSFRQLTNADGLRNLDLTAVALDASGNVWSGSSTGYIHVYDPATGSLRTIFDIATAEDQTNKSINAIVIHGDTALICTDFGLTVFRVQKFEFGDTYSRFGNIPAGTRTAVFSALIHDGKLRACISDGQTYNFVAGGDLSNPNLLPPESWSLLTVGSSATIPSSLAVFNGKLYAGTSSGLFVEEPSGWTPVAGFPVKAVAAIAASPSVLVIAATDGTVYSLNTQNTTTQLGSQLPSTANAIAAGGAGEPVIGSSGMGILTLGSTWVSHAPNGPNASSFVSVVADHDGVIWGGSGDVTGHGLYRFNGTTWKNFTVANSALPTNSVYRVAVSCDGSLWASTYGSGVVVIARGDTTIDTAKIYSRNVGMTGVPNDHNYVVPSNAVCDGQGNVWMSVILAADKNLLSMRQANGTWRNLPVIYGGVKLTTLNERQAERLLAVDAFSNLWAASRDGTYPGVISLGNAGSVDSTVAFYLTKNDGLPSNGVKTIVTDLDNDVWVGTDLGIAIILDPSNPRRSGGIAAYKPLNGLVVNTIAVDPLNQKWVGTTEGAFLLSPDGTQTLASYTVENTAGKLIDNDIKSIAIDRVTGTVYFGTNYGLASLTTAGAEPRQSFGGLTVYPNPFHIPATVPLTVSGLVANSSIKIVSIDGNVIRDVITPGGLIGFWDGKDNDGNDVASGVYLIVAYSEDGSAVANGKVAVIKD